MSESIPVKEIIIGDKKRSVFVIKPNPDRKSNVKKVKGSSIIRKSRGCGGCSRRRRSSG